MTPQEKRKELLSATLLKKLERRHFEAYYCPTATEAIEKVLSLIPEGSSITWGGSMTIRDMGLTKAVKEGNYNVIDRDTAANPAEMREMMRQGLLCDYYLTSTNAISEDGVLTVASNETSTSITVTAKSKQDSTKTGTATVTVQS